MIFLVGEEPDVQRIPAHSWILIEKNPVFRAMLTGPLAANILNNAIPKSPLGHKRRRTVSGNSIDKNAAYSSLSTIPDNEEEHEENDDKTEDPEDEKPIEFEVKLNQEAATDGAKALSVPIIVVQEDSEADEAEDYDSSNMMSSARSLVMPASTPHLMGGNKTNPIPVSDVDGRTFDIVLR